MISPQSFPRHLGVKYLQIANTVKLRQRPTGNREGVKGGANWLSTIVYKGNNVVANYTESGLSLFGDFKRNLNIHCAKLTD